MEKNKGLNLLQKFYRYRLKIDRNGTPIVNLSSLFSIACLIFAPHMSIAGIVLSLILGYHISLETEGDAGDLEETVRNAAETVKKTAASAAKTIRQEMEKVRSDASAHRDTAGSAADAPDTGRSAEQVNQEIVEELKTQMESEIPHGNPAAYHTAYTATAGSVPTLRVQPEESVSEEPREPKAHFQL